MDLALWRVSRTLRAEGVEPSPDHPAVRDFLDQYGHRTVREIELGVPRWRDDPDHILRLLSSYAKQGAAAGDPERHFEEGAAAAGQAVTAVTAAVHREKGMVRALVIRVLLSRFRQLAGIREWHKFYLSKVLATVRRVLLTVGADLVQEGWLDQAEDVFFLEFADLGPGGDLRPLVARNRTAYERESRRPLAPPAITSDGEVSYGTPETREGMLTGTGASAGVHEGTVRIVYDPQTGRLEPGEILVAPGTDPAWTPLFLTAGALIAETGGMMSHGSIVAREYGIPAVVGVPQATTLLRTGQRVRVDGGAGVVVLLDRSVQSPLP